MLKGTAEALFQGKTGAYSVKVHYFDENDGAASASVTVGGEKQSFKFDKNLPADFASAKILTSRVE
ncbi:hypothetical protein IQ241_03350 [Romeria aff. gracilis LEGE 07310]|uniref:Uncharacterized protein n=1 Tax=Vasconcelosia minhoensis LEGE 07310 TaxID=915328 RepID=A0A8J7DMC6_9CYAN|nr:hypothetical protein [Romeria gracilis]MBE9076340.1 hypothetical protein [Romeria aff. gracilis LEGE 07310]